MNIKQKIVSVGDSRSISNGMKKFLIAGAFVAASCMPALALAAYNDVQLTTSAVFSVGGITINVSGPTASVASITVTDSSTLSIVMQQNSSITLTAPNRNQMNASAPSSISTQYTCDNNSSVLTLTASGAVTVTVTPSATLCTTAATATASGSNGAPSGGGGGGGGSVLVTTPAPATTPTTAAKNTTAQGNTGTASALQARLDALNAQIAALTGKAAPSSSAYANASGNASFKRSLTVGSIGADVKSLQVYLNAHGFAVAASGPGSPGNETSKFGRATKAALAKWQASVGIKPASGLFGPLTRAYIAAHP